MAEVLVQDTSLQAIADAIREKNGTETTYKPSEMGTAIRAIESGGGDYTSEQIMALIDGSITDFVIPDGITMICRYAFYYRNKLKNITIPESCTIIGESAFQGCALANINLPKNLKEVKTRGFAECGLVITQLPTTLETIGDLAFSYGTTSILKIPASVKVVGKSVFYQNKSLTEITFEGTPTNMAGDVFHVCPNLSVINVPWSEGEVANAPWGATNATINYNYTGD